MCKTAFYGVKFVHRLYGQPDPTNSVWAVNMLEAIRRIDDQHTVKKDPLSPEAFRKIYRELMTRTGTLEDVRTCYL